MHDAHVPFSFLPAGLDPAAGRARAAAVRRDRAVTELRRGRPLALSCPSGWLLAASVEVLSPDLWQQLLAAGPAPRLLLSGERLQALGRPGSGAPAALALPADVTLAQLQQLAAVTAEPGPPGLPDAPLCTPPDAPSDTPQDAPGEALAWSAGLALCKQGRLIPALVLVALPPEAGQALAAAQVLQFDPADVAPAAPGTGNSPGPLAGLRRVSDARVPLAAEEDCTLVLFREVDGDAEHVAIIVGRPPTDAPVPVRLHSACLTGDLLGSLRCDCGPQLQRAVARLAETGGVLLYLAQEGRGTGLANKLRAYRLQDAGLDTLQADRALGFREDERDFTPAAAMLKALGYARIQLLTNNPQKIAALREAGIEVLERLALHGQVNTHNERYIRTKQQAGHLVGDD